MKKLSFNLPATLEKLGRDVPNARQQARAAQVRGMWKTAVEDIYKDSASLFLAHTNAVYLMNKEEIRTLIVYVDESIFAAELNAQRELFKLKFLQRFNEDVEEFEIHISRGNYKLQHPYLQADDRLSFEKIDKRTSQPLNEEELAQAHRHVDMVENEKVREALLKAIIADEEWKKGQH